MTHSIERIVQGHRARPQISGCLEGLQNSTLGGQEVRTIGRFWSKFYTQRRIIRGQNIQRRQFSGLEGQKGRILPGGSSQAAAILWAWDFTAGF
jgi:hypothetical protein